MELKNFKYQNHTNSHMYYSPLPGRTINVETSDPFIGDGCVVGFIYSLIGHEVIKVWMEHHHWGVVEISPNAIEYCTDDDLWRLFTKVSA